MNQYGYTSPTLCCVPTSLQPCGLTATRISLTLSDRALPQTYLLYSTDGALEAAPHLHETVLRRLIYLLQLVNPLFISLDARGERRS